MAERNRPHACLDEDCLSDSDHACCGGPSCDVCHPRVNQGQPESAPLAHELIAGLTACLREANTGTALSGWHIAKIEQAIAALSAAPPAQPHPSQDSPLAHELMAALESALKHLPDVASGRQPMTHCKRAIEHALDLLRASQPLPETLKLADELRALAKSQATLYPSERELLGKAADALSASPALHTERTT